MKQGWEIKKVGECFDSIKNGATIKQERGATGIPITRIETLSGGVFNRDRLGYANIHSAEKYASYILDDGDMLLSHINSKTYIGRTVVYNRMDNEEIIHGMNLLRLKTIRTILSPYYAFYCFKSESFRNQIASYRKDAVNQSSIPVSDLKKISIPVPPLPEQEKIVSELDCLSDIIEKKRQQLRELDALAQSIFYEMFGNPVENEKGWEVRKIGDVCADKKAIKRANKHFNKEDKIQYIDIASINNKVNIIEGTTPYILEDAPSRAQQVVIFGDILISLVRPNLKNIAIVQYTDNSLVASSGFCVLRTGGNVDKAFLKQVVLNDSFTTYLMDRVAGANYPAVREEDIKQCQIGIPPLPLQQSFAQKIESIEKQKELIKQSIVEVETLFNSRMDFYFN